MKCTVSSQGITITADGYENAMEILNRHLAANNLKQVEFAEPGEIDLDDERKYRDEPIY